VLPAIFDLLPPAITASTAMAMEAAKENLAEQKQAERLPESDCVPSEDRRHQNIPQALHDEAKYDAADDDEECDSNSFEYWMTMHV
jgi:hypothetical protein